MKCVIPQTEILTVEHDGITYEKEYYKSASTITGVIDESYQEWDSTTTFAAEQIVKISSLKRLYKSAADNNTDNFPLATLGTKWVDWGAINSQRMFLNDEFIGTKTTGVDIVETIDFSQNDTIALIDIEFQGLQIELIDDDTQETVSTQNILGSDIGCLTFAEYFYNPKDKLVKRLVITGLEWLPSSTLKLTFTGAVSIGTRVYGLQQDMGFTLVGSKLRYEDRSKIKVNEVSGYRDVLRYGNIRILDCSVVFDTDEFNPMSQLVESVLGKSILWIPTTKDKFSESISIGYIEDFDLPLENASMTETQTRIIGVSK